MYSSQTETSADNSSDVSFKVSPRTVNHQIQIQTSGTVTAGTASVSCDSQTISGEIALTSPAPMILEGSFSTISVSPDSFDGDSFTATLRSW